MRDGIMHVQQIDIIIHDHIYHGAGQRSFIRRVIEQRVSRYAHFMIKNIGMKLTQPHRLLVGNEMNLVSFVGQRFSQFCSQYTAAAKSRITDNSYAHSLLLSEGSNVG